ncbi:unnamed protein product [Cuscuta epithymum]|uniref:RING-type domain-containing protein n=1 Tax=Cuscuta epithymum TaxID=186058 RepID=A0AAV0EMY9_9ASTE|nr:unnamed protein product [Cuscuta epithymum]
MSISPSQNQLGSASSSSSHPGIPRNPNSNNGFVSFPHQHQPEDPSLLISGLDSTRIADSGSSSSSYCFPSETSSLGAAALESCASSDTVNLSSNQEDIETLSYDVGEVSVNDRGKSPRLSVNDRGKSSRASLPPISDNSYSGTIRSQGTMPRSAGRRTQMVSGNHLLNFHYDPISRPKSIAPHPRKMPKRKPYNKDLFLQANYKFVVFGLGIYVPELMDPDKMLEWEDIICVKFSTSFPVQCPICLEDPLCPQITSCGHIFCFPCIMQYFSGGEDDYRGECWKKCPLCFMMISCKDMCTVQIENVKQYLVGDDINFLLLTRQKDSYSLSLKSNNDDVDACEEALDSFSKFTFTTDVDLSVREPMSDLDSWLARADSGLVDDLEKLPYVCAAMEQLQQRKKYWNEQRVSDRNNKLRKDSSCDKGSYTPPSNVNKSILHENSSLKNKLLPTPTGEVQLPKDRCESFPSVELGKNTQEVTGALRDSQNTNSYIFYQAADGQHLIIHPLNMKCLLHYYGNYDRLPNRISGKILQLETMTQSEAIRKRYRYLSHISLTTSIKLCEIDLCNILPVEALSPFMTEIKKRETQRKRVARKEQHVKIKAETTTFQYVLPPYNQADTTYADMPAFTNDDFEALGTSAVISSSPPAVQGRQLFSNVAKLGFAAAHDSPALKLGESPLTTETSHSSSVERGARHAGTTATLTFANVTSRHNAAEASNISNASEVGKKGKKPNRVLLSTAVSRRY